MILCNNIKLHLKEHPVGKLHPSSGGPWFAHPPVLERGGQTTPPCHHHNQVDDACRQDHCHDGHGHNGDGHGGDGLVVHLVHVGTVLTLDRYVAARSIETRRANALDPILSQFPTSASVQAVLVTPILVLASGTTPPILADATSLVMLQGGVGGDRLADSVVAALPSFAGSVHQADVAQRPSPVWAAGTEAMSSQLDAGSPVAAFTQSFAGHKVCQSALTLGTVVLRWTEAATCPSISDSYTTMSTIPGETYVILTEPPFVHGIRTKALWLAVLQVAGAVVLARKTETSSLLHTSRTGDSRLDR